MNAESNIYHNIDITLDLEEGDNIQFIDPKLRGLVLGVNGLGIKTRAACEGHLDRKRKYPFPWISISPFLCFSHQDRLDRLSGLLEEFNQGSEIKWELEEAQLSPSEETLRKFGLTPSIIEKLGDPKQPPNPLSEQELSVMHQSAHKLAELLARNPLSRGMFASLRPHPLLAEDDEPQRASRPMRVTKTIPNLGTVFCE